MAKDIWQRWLHPNTDDRYLSRWTRLWILIIGISSSFGAMTLPKILHQAFFVYSIRGALMICVAFGLWWKRSHPDAAFWSLLVALVGGIMYQFNLPFNFETFFKLHISTFCAILSLITFLYVSWRSQWTKQTASELPPFINYERERKK